LHANGQIQAADGFPSPAEPGEAEGSALGARIRDARQQRGLSVGALAEQAGVSKSLVSQIERGVAAPSLDTVRRLASALEVPVFSLFLEEADSHSVVRRRQRRTIRYPGTRAVRQVLSPHLRGRMALVWVTFPPGEESSAEPVRHTGEETVVVLRGRLEVQLADQRVVLEEGDSMTFDPQVPHLFRNPGEESAEAISAISPPNL
jgi:transcriptional regulator with XRE-family HTH domain